jgi:hypothetical protein
MPPTYSSYAQNIRSNSLSDELETEILGSPLSPEEKPQVKGTAAALISLKTDEKRGLSPIDSFKRSLMERNESLAQEKLKLLEADKKGLSRPQMVGMALVALAPFLGKMFGGDRGGAAAAAGATEAATTVGKFEEAQADRDAKFKADEIDAINSERAANSKAAADIEKSKLLQDDKYAQIDAIKTKHPSKGTNVTINGPQDPVAQRQNMDELTGGENIARETQSLLNFVDTFKGDETLSTLPGIGNYLSRNFEALDTGTAAGQLLTRFQQLKTNYQAGAIKGAASDKDIALIEEGLAGKGPFKTVNGMKKALANFRNNILANYNTRVRKMNEMQQQGGFRELDLDTIMNRAKEVDSMPTGGALEGEALIDKAKADYQAGKISQEEYAKVLQGI